MSSNHVFADFAEFWSFAKSFTDEQRRVILKSLPKDQRQELEDNCRKEGWKDLFLRNELDTFLDEIKAEHGVDLVRLRVLVLDGKAVYINKKFWQFVQTKKFKGYKPKQTHYIFGGIRATESEYSTEEYKLVPNGG